MYVCVYVCMYVCLYICMFVILQNCTTPKVSWLAQYVCTYLFIDCERSELFYRDQCTRDYIYGIVRLAFWSHGVPNVKWDQCTERKRSGSWKFKGQVMK